jgi:outer membrane protein OmpA-like peptidoglycan-associated protein
MKNNNSEWMSISDMMSGLMLIFMFIAISFMIQVQFEKDKIKEVAKAYEKDKIELNKDLNKEFKNDLKKWNAEITKDNIIVFNSPNVLFENGKSKIKNEFKNILIDFFPRYIKILTSKKYKNEIDELRIEGHTSNIWRNAHNPKEVYLNNMRLSQNRANSVLNFSYLIDNEVIDKNRRWLEKHLRANGMAFSKLRYKNNKIDFSKSRRVEFRVKMMIF